MPQRLSIFVGAMAEVPDDRNRRRGGGLAVERRFGPLRQHAELGELRREQLLVGGHDRLARGQRRDQDRLDGGAARGFDDDVDLGIADELERAIGDRDAGRARPAILGHVAHRDPRDAEPHAIAIGDRVASADRSSRAGRGRPCRSRPGRCESRAPARRRRLRSAAAMRSSAACRTRRRRAAGRRGDPDRRETRRARTAIPASRATNPRPRPAARDAARPAAPTGTACRRARRRRWFPAVTRAHASRTACASPIDSRSIASLSSRNVLTGKRSANRRP